MADLIKIRQSYESHQITEIRSIDGNKNHADAMTKARPCPELINLIDTITIFIEPSGSVERSYTYISSRHLY